MKYLKQVFIVISCLFSTVQAQMTDQQVLDYAKAKRAAGESVTMIAKELVDKGVSQEQLKRIKYNYESGNNSTIVTEPKYIDRERHLNGEKDPDLRKHTKMIFGHDLFRTQNLSFQPSMNIATPTDYKLGPGDELILDIYGASQTSEKMKVAPDGTITISDEGPVNVSGLTLSKAQNKIQSTIGRHYQGSSIKLSVGQTRTIMVNVMGEVTTPGTYTLSAFSTVFNAVYLAGGITDIGTLRNIQVSRNGKVITSVDVYDFIVNGSLTGNIILQDNDVIMVGPYENLVKIEGKVKRPMFYELKKNESLSSLIKYSGGFTGDAYKEKVRVERRSSEGLTVHIIEESNFHSFHNEDEDVVVVSPIIERYKNTVTITGAVFRPGSYKIDESVNSVKTIIDQAGGLLEQAVTSRAVLLRMKEDRTLVTESIPLELILKGETPDISLRNEDRLIISSYSKLASERKMAICGEVMYPGSYDFSENTTIGDLITMAGGLKESASLEKVEVARRITSSQDNSDGNQMAKVFTFNLDCNLSTIEDHDFKLQPYDQITIHRNPNYKVQKSVYIGGEVEFEGYYTLSSKEERLSSLIERAGGLKNKAYISGTKLIRKYTTSEIKDRHMLIEMAQTWNDSIAAYRNMRKTSYSIGIDLSKALKDKNGENDIILESGDSIYVPPMSSVVKVYGEVLSPNTITYHAKKKAKYYINQAGGITEKGCKRKAYVLYANGQVSTLRKGKIEPGCEIIVPSKMEKKIDVAKVGMWATIASTVATVAAVITVIIK